MPRTTLSLLLACATLLASSAAFAFNPQPDPPGRHGVVAGKPVQTDFNPQPDPPGRHQATACPKALGTQRDASSGLGSGKRTVDGNTERKSGGQLSGTDLNAAGAGSSGGEACGFEQPK
jgi:hypothetical protein